ncbi:uncharacterized protein LOC125669242 isoform X6 [Ostrea edulis]|uniref:uncharacterized protein LOC125669242 isoform X6 n=1 Tax=Ostrea edulis TaxID=37623 RepID=UPI0024AF9045|nr:uncharacterized protein LOC125669242 isoform X6 [Ostrea edulis]
MNVLKFFRKTFGKRRRNSVECEAVLSDYDKISHSAREMRKNNNDIHCVYQSIQEDMITDIGEQLQHSEELMNEVAKSLTDMEKMAERACEILRAEKEKFQQKQETLAKLKEDVEELEHRLSSAKMAVHNYTERNLEDEVVIESVQLFREKLQQDHDLHVRHLQNECVNLEKKNTLLKFREKHFQTNEGKTELLTFFRVPKEEQEATKKRFASLKKRKEALLEKVQGQRRRKLALAEYNSHLEKTIEKKKHGAMLS